MIEDADIPGPADKGNPDEGDYLARAQPEEELTWREELLLRARETARRIQERVRRALGGGRGRAAKPVDQPPGEE